MPASETSNLWRLARSGRQIDADAFAAAVAEEAGLADTDFRTELLIRDALDALNRHWGGGRMGAWLAEQSHAARLDALWTAAVGPAGFPTLVNRMMDAVKPSDVLAFFRELGSRTPKQERLEVGGSTSLILAELIARQTDDVDVVDQVPDSIRGQHDVLAELATAYGLRLTHFQSHYLPTGWRKRMRSLGRFGKLDVFLVDVYDVLAGKLTSSRRKDLDDLRAVAGVIDKRLLAKRLGTAGATLLAEPKLAENAARNWYVVYGEVLPTAP